MNVKVITLPEAKERQSRITASFKANSIPFQFRDGIEFKDCQFHEINGKHYVENKRRLFEINEDKFISNTNRTWMRFGEIAAYIAHYNVWKEFNNSDDETILICEDDAYPQSDMKFLNEINFDGVGFVNLQTVTAHNQDKQTLYREPFVSFANNGLVKYENYIKVLCEGLAAYMITKLGAKLLCSYIEENGFVGPNDCLIAQLAEQKLMPVYSPIDLYKCFGLDPETNKISYTHTGTFKNFKQFNKTSLQIKEQNVFTH
jgi:GR25 family glycosyltransferase involved in LPS biosynthesis